MLIVTIALFIIGIISISFEQVLVSSLVSIGFLILMRYKKEQRFISSLFMLFLIGFTLFIFTNHLIEPLTISKEIKIILNRLFLIFIIIALVFHSLCFSRKFSWYNNKPDWKNSIDLKYHRVHIFWFWMIGVIVNGIIYFSFIVQRDFELIQSLFWFCLIFSLINAVFEEVIWRGYMLSALVKFTSAGYAVFITSIGFGLLHLAIGFSLALSLLISAAGVIYAVITLKTNSIYPSMVFHFVVNIGMVYSGFIIK